MTDAIRRVGRSAGFAVAADPLRAGFVLAITVMAGAAPVLTTWATGLTVDAVAAREPTRAVIMVLLAMLLAMAWTQLLPPLQQYVESELSRRVELRAQQRSFDKINSLGGLRNFENPRFHDQLQLAVSAGVEAPVQLLESLTSMLRASVTLVGFTVSLIAVDPMAAVLVALAGVPRLIVELRLGRDRYSLRAELTPSERLGMMYASLQTDAQAAREIRLFGLGEHFVRLMLGELRWAQGKTRALDARTARTQSALELLSLVPVALCLLLVIWRVGQGVVQPGDIVVLLGALAAADGALTTAVVSLARINELSLMVRQFDDLMAVAPDVQRHTGMRAPALERLEFRDVWFRYRPDLPWVVRGVNLTIEAGASVGLVGLNGAGKSTMIKLLSRFYDPDHGTITWNGIGLAELDVDSLRDRLGAVFQDFMSYDLSVRDNVIVGDLAATPDDARVWWSLEQVGLAEAVRALPRGLDTVLTTSMFGHDHDEEFTDKGLNELITDEPGAADGTSSYFSGGQWQRLAIARMLLRLNRDLLVLDEPSSGLDPQAEYELNEVVRTTAAGRARLMVSHRLNAVRGADKIIVLSDGKIVEEGTHEQLIHLRGDYHRLFDLQSRGYVDDIPGRRVDDETAERDEPQPGRRFRFDAPTAELVGVPNGSARPGGATTEKRGMQA